MSRIITLTTDFGLADTYVAAMKGVILSINPEATTVDLCHSVPAQDVAQGAFLLAMAYAFFPQDTIHVAVVDPGVGTARRPILLATRDYYFVAPDNGLLSYILEEALGPEPGRSRRSAGLYSRKIKPPLEAIHLTTTRFWRPSLSATFHGRDLFAPVAAHLSLGVTPREFGKKVSSLLAFSLPRPRQIGKDKVVGRVIHIDSFGNLITNIRRSELPSDRLRLEVRGRCLEGISPSYAAGGSLLALVGSGDRLEIAARNGRAETLLGAKVGDEVAVFPSARRRRQGGCDETGTYSRGNPRASR